MIKRQTAINRFRVVLEADGEFVLIQTSSSYIVLKEGFHVSANGQTASSADLILLLLKQWKALMQKTEGFHRSGVIVWNSFCGHYLCFMKLIQK